MAPPEHGLYTTYNNHKCRCRPCTDAKSEYQRDYFRNQRRLARIGRAVVEITREERQQ